MNHKIQLMIADDHEIYLDGLKGMLNQCDDLSVIGDASTGRELLSLCEEYMPDVVLTDIFMPVMDGIQATQWLADHLPSVRVIALSMFNQDHLILDMLNAGAGGYLIKNANKHEIVEAIHSVYNNKPYYCSSTSFKLARLIARSGFSPKAKRKIQFSEREIDIIRMICQEKTAREIGNKLNISARTAEEYRQRIRDKMDVRGTVGMVIYAIRNEIFRLEDYVDQ